MESSELNVKVAELEGWTLSQDDKSIRKSYEFKDFATALAFVNLIGALAEADNHHPDIELSWGKVVVKLSTHSEGGVSEKDFALAGKIDTL